MIQIFKKKNLVNKPLEVNAKKEIDIEGMMNSLPEDYREFLKLYIKDRSIFELDRHTLRLKDTGVHLWIANGTYALKFYTSDLLGIGEDTFELTDGQKKFMWELLDIQGEWRKRRIAAIKKIQTKQKKLKKQK